MSEALRAFIAAPLPDALRCRLGSVALEMQAEPWAEGVRWVRADNLHLTLRFLGNVSFEALSRIESCVAEEVAAQSAFESVVSGVGLFPSVRRPRIVAAELAPCPPLEALAARVEKAVVAAGRTAEQRAFRSHITLGRMRRRATGPPTVDIELEPCVCPVESVVLYRSELRPSGAVYSVLAKMPLGRHPHS